MSNSSLFIVLRLVILNKNALTICQSLRLIISLAHISSVRLVRSFVRPFVHPSVRPSVLPSVLPPSVRSFANLVVRQSVRLSVRPFVPPSVRSSVRVYLLLTTLSVIGVVYFPYLRYQFKCVLCAINNFEKQAECFYMLLYCILDLFNI